MTRRRWIADEVEGDRAALVGEHALHLARVLRARVGQEFDVSAGGHVRRGRVTAVKDAESGNDVRVEFELAEEVEVPEQVPITLLLGIFKFDRMEWAIEKCTELGVASIVPVIARRTDVHLAKAAEKRVDRWRRIAVQASEQSRRSSIPDVHDPIKLPTALPRCGGTRIVLAESETELTLNDVAYPEGEPIYVAIGPEGGWTAEELGSFATDGWQSVSLGTNILRSETAAIAAVALTIAAKR